MRKIRNSVGIETLHRLLQEPDVRASEVLRLSKIA